MMGRIESTISAVALRAVLVLAFLVCFAAMFAYGCSAEGGKGAQNPLTQTTSSTQSSTQAGATTTEATETTTAEGERTRTDAVEEQYGAAAAAPEAAAAGKTVPGGGGAGQATTSGEGSEGPGGARPSTLFPGVEDDTGGLLTDHRMVSYYGHPFSAAMGELGQYEDPQVMVESLKEQAAAYTEADPDLPAAPTIELIASVAQPAPGEDGDYLKRTPPGVIEEYAQLAEENGLELLLDVQIGRSTVAEEIEAIRPFLKRPYVHLAIDTEYDMAPGEVPAKQVGSTPAREIKDAARTLSEIVEAKDLPAKVMVVHQFQYGMIENKAALTLTPNVETVIHADGFGYKQTKYSKYRALVESEPVQYGGFKLFYDQDSPLLTPEQVLSDLEPPPAVVSYQ